MRIAVFLLSAAAFLSSCGYGYEGSREAHDKAVARAQVAATMPPPPSPEVQAKAVALAAERDRLIAKWKKERSPAEAAALNARLTAWEEYHRADGQLRDACMTAMAGDSTGIVACSKFGE